VRACGKGGAVRGSDSGASMTRRRPEEGDDGWGPPASHNGRAAHGSASGPEARRAKQWREGKRSAKKRSRGTTGLLEVGCATKQEKTKEGFSFFFKINQTNEFKHTFEFKRSKTMHLHVCNNKLLYFII
jgi:hypothetical protein